MKSKLRAVIRHEYLTIVKQPTFLLTMLALPILMATIFGISFTAERTAQTNIEEATERIDNVVIVDESGLIILEVTAGFNIELRSSEERESTITEVKNEEIDGAIIYPVDIRETHRFEIFIGGGDDILLSSAMADIGNNILQTSLAVPLGDPEIAALIRQGASSGVTAYENGEETAGTTGSIVPGAFLAIFFIILFFSMGYMLLGVAEEKENRSMEMVLSYVPPRTLIVGKLLGVSLVALTQLTFFTALGTAALLIVRRFEEQVSIPFDIDFSSLVFDPVTIIIGIFALVFGFLFFAALMSGVASMAPGVKEANSFSTVFFILPFVPFWSAGVITTAPESVLVRFLTFFPVTSPTTLLFRNTLGNIDTFEAIAAIIVLIISTALAFMLAAKLFRLGALEFSDRLKLSAIFKKL